MSPSGLHGNYGGFEELLHVANALRVIERFLRQASEQLLCLSKAFLIEEAPDLSECVILRHGQEYERWLARIASNMLLK